MMIYPQLEIENTSREMQEQFGGYNHNLRIPETDFYDMKNITGDYFPILSPRAKRGYQKTLNDYSSMICKGVLCYIANGHLYINGDKVESFDNTTTSNLGKISGITYYTNVMVSMGAYLVIFRKSEENGITDGWYVNTKNLSEHGYIDVNKHYSNPVAQSEMLVFTTCGADGKDYVISYTGDSAPTGNITNGQKWLDTSGEKHYIKVWSSSQNMWVTLSTTYIKISRVGINNGLKEGDAITLGGLAGTESMSAALVKQFESLNSTNIISSIGEGWIVITGILDTSVSYSGECYIKRQAPYMDFICESGNRLWGCRYGLNRSGDVVNEIYACKQGDFKNWQCYAGISTDSYAVSVGSEELWTGCIPYGQYILFFKENCIHKLYGTMPSNYQLIEQKVRGVQKGSEKSLCIVNETLFYKSISDVCYYDGSLPTGISADLGSENYNNAVAASIKSKLYLNMQDSSGVWHLFIYDMTIGRWFQEDNIHCKDICRVGNELYFVDDYDNLGTFTGTGTLESDVEWYAETGEIGYLTTDNKYLSKLTLRLKKPVTSKISVLIKYDNKKAWETISSIGGSDIFSITLPIIPRRCDHFRLRFEGKGDCKIISITKTIEIGSDL